MLIDNGDTIVLLPSDFAEAMGRGEPVEYGRWAEEELQNERFWNTLLYRKESFLVQLVGESPFCE